MSGWHWLKFGPFFSFGMFCVLKTLELGTGDASYSCQSYIFYDLAI